MGVVVGLGMGLGLQGLEAQEAQEGGGEGVVLTCRVEIPEDVELPGEGVLYLALLQEGQEADPESMTDGRRVPVDRDGARRLTFVFEGLTPGRYGLQGFIDGNGNGKMDLKRVLGVPVGPGEPWMVSLPEGKRLLGPPKFEDFAFDLREDKTVVLTVKG